MAITDKPTFLGADPRIQPDGRDEAILRERVAAYNTVEGPRVGDFVRFADGVERRISYIWDEGAGDGFWVTPGPRRMQTSHPGAGFYLGNGYVSMGNGSLFRAVPESTLTDTGEVQAGQVWFFHHDHMTAHNGVYATIPHRVYACTEEAPRA